jgi:hypothetical protein
MFLHVTLHVPLSYVVERLRILMQGLPLEISRTFRTWLGITRNLIGIYGL